MTLQYKGGARVPGPLGTFPDGIGGRAPGPIGRTLWDKQAPSPAPAAEVAAANQSSNPKALIVLGTGHDGIKKGVRLKTDDYFDKAALVSFAPYTKGHDVTIKHVKSAAEMKQLIGDGTWDVVIYFGHGVENEMALAPDETGKRLTKEELVKALQASGTKQVYLFGCKAGETGLARKLSKDLPGATVYGTFGSLDVDWEQRKDPDGTFTNKFAFKEVLTEYNSGFQMKNGKKTNQRRHERGDPIIIGDDPFGESMVDQ